MIKWNLISFSRSRSRTNCPSKSNSKPRWIKELGIILLIRKNWSKCNYSQSYHSNLPKNDQCSQSSLGITFKKRKIYDTIHSNRSLCLFIRSYNSVKFRSIRKVVELQWVREQEMGRWLILLDQLRSERSIFHPNLYQLRSSLLITLVFQTMGACSSFAFLYDIRNTRSSIFGEGKDMLKAQEGRQTLQRHWQQEARTIQTNGKLIAWRKLKEDIIVL